MNSFQREPANPPDRGVVRRLGEENADSLREGRDAERPERTTDVNRAGDPGINTATGFRGLIIDACLNAGLRIVDGSLRSPRMGDDYSGCTSANCAGGHGEDRIIYSSMMERRGGRTFRYCYLASLDDSRGAVVTQFRNRVEGFRRSRAALIIDRMNEKADNHHPLKMR
ncbi:hypothetical protein BDZ89DRAFT_1114915 [Hymenopellis radicata]|nr:hypothetical protein BDZ89DRAFT_1114915 [Hymenopellis radicata]